MKRLAGLCAVALLASGLAACASTRPAGTFTLDRDLTVALPAGSSEVSAHRVAQSATSPLLHLLAAPEHVEAAGRLPGRAVLTFGVGHVGGTPFLAWLDAGAWVPVPSTYNARAGTVSASVTHFSIWAAFNWATPQLQAWVGTALRGVLGLGTATAPVCGGGASATDSNPGHPTISACAEAGPAADGASAVTVKIANLRAYPFDLSYPAQAAGQCGQAGACVQVTPAADPWLKLGGVLQQHGSSTLVPGSSTASVIVPIPPGQSVSLQAAVDTPAMFMAFAEAGIGVFTAIIGDKIKAIQVTGEAIDALSASNCTSEALGQAAGPLGLAAEARLAKEAFGCLGSVLPDILRKLGFKAASLLIGAFKAATGFVSAAVSSVWGLYDQFFGSHVLTISAAQACPTSAELVAAWEAAPASAQEVWAAPSAAISGFQSITCWNGWVVTVPLAAGISFILFSQANGLHVLSAAELNVFSSAACLSPRSPSEWKNPASGPVICNY